MGGSGRSEPGGIFGNGETTPSRVLLRRWFARSRSASPPGRSPPPSLRPWALGEAVSSRPTTGRSTLPSSFEKKTGQRWNSSQEKRYEALARKRDKAAESLEIESSVIAPRAALEQIALEADPAEHLLGWQRALLEL